ncbi:MAG: hypothetical protein V3V03_03965, partial [Hyphomonadaceae bacterium]
MTETDTPIEKPARPLWIKLWPVYIIAGGLIAARQFGLFEYFSIDTLREQQDVLLAYVDAHRFL